ncbi:MAG: helix-turn-helix domain-containing protein [Deltaproteobacteria bacterium]|nr:helix-turn-helix domain-containing protein [Deltaproteobacteria bacterium]
MPRKKTRLPKTALARRLTLAMSERDPMDIARRAGISKTAVYNYMAGDRAPQSAILHRLASVCGVSLEWLLATNDQVRDVSGHVPDDLPVVGRAGAGRGEFSEDGFPVGEGWRRVSRPYDLKDANAFGVEVRGHSMSPRYEDREIVVCSPDKEWHSGDYCVVKTVGGEYLIKRIKRENGNLVLISIAHGYDPIIMPLSEIAGIYRIVWKKER